MSLERKKYGWIPSTWKVWLFEILTLNPLICIVNMLIIKIIIIHFYKKLAIFSLSYVVLNIYGQQTFVAKLVLVLVHTGQVGNFK